jgi:hypothetical protein
LNPPGSFDFHGKGKMTDKRGKVIQEGNWKDGKFAG